MNKSLLTISIVLVLGLLITGLTTPIFAHSPDDSGATPANEEAWEAMHEACESGDWKAMAEAAEKTHGEDWYNHMGGSMWDNGWDGDMSGHMGGGMMGW